MGCLFLLSYSFFFVFVYLEERLTNLEMFGYNYPIFAYGYTQQNETIPLFAFTFAFCSFKE